MESATNFDGTTYQARLDALTAQGIDMHGEASLVRSYQPTTVLDAGCGTGRVAIELARHGIDVVGVDVDASMLTEATRIAPELQWLCADLATLTLDRTFDVVILAGNVPLFCNVASRPALIKRSAAHVRTGGLMISGFQLGKGYELADYDQQCKNADLVLVNRWSTWDRLPFRDGNDYVVSVHSRPI